MARCFAEQPVVKGSSWTCDLIANTLHNLAVHHKVDLRDYQLSIQGDNCSKEIKSNAVSRLLGLLVCRRKIRKAFLQTLVTGHSHEDIDQFFSLLGAFLQNQVELHNSVEFEEAVSRFLANKSVRPTEPVRIVQRVHLVRDWNPGVAQKGLNPPKQLVGRR